MNKKDMEVLINVISAVESGGQVYGQRDYAAYADPYKNSPEEHTVTLGWAQNYGYNAKELVKRIFENNPAAFRKLDSAGIEDMLRKDWVALRWAPSYAQRLALIRIIDSPVGHTCQDALFAEQIQASIDDCERDYSADPKTVIMYCEIRHLGGKPAADRILSRCKAYDLDSIMASLVADQRDPKQNQVGDQKYWSRHLKCRQFIDEHIEDEVMITAEKLLDTARKYLGCNEHDGSHRQIIDGYNTHKPLARGYTVKYTDAWCATFVSFIFIVLGAVSLIGKTECGVDEFVEIFRNKGIWLGRCVPKAGDIIVFDWQGDNVEDHIGIVEKVDGDTITTIEGNYQDSVARRVIAYNDYRICGYARPKYAKQNDSGALQPAQKFDKNLAGTYETKQAANMRFGPSSKKYGVITKLPAGTKCKNYGYYSLNSTAKWLYVQAEGHTGYVSSGMLKRV